MGSRKARRYHPKVCDGLISFEDCELAILRQAVDQNQKKRGARLVNQQEIKTMIAIVEDFLGRKKLLCYGGTAINNILPKAVQFYDYTSDVPDYDFFSDHALRDAKELADEYAAAGYTNVEAKSGMHHGTYKVYVNFIPVADVTNIHGDLFRALKAASVSVAGIHYVPPDFLRMSMYLELSRPDGDLSRWEKVLKRLTLLNKFYPIKLPKQGCRQTIFQRQLDDAASPSSLIFDTVRSVFVEMGVVFFGGYASSLYSRYMPADQRRLVEKHPDFDVLYEDPKRCATIVTERLADLHLNKRVKIVHHEAIGELVPESVQLLLGRDTIAFIYKPIACHNYNTVTIDHRQVRVATIDTILSFYLAFLFLHQTIYSAFRNRHLCMVTFLFELEQKNRLAQTGLLRRFTSQCYGTQETMESIRAQKAAKFAEFKTNRGSNEYQEWFLNYHPTVETTPSPPRRRKSNKAWLPTFFL
jgi:hypothetical protein